MSVHIYQRPPIEVRIGYDRPLRFVFCTVEDLTMDEYLYSNLNDPQAGTFQQDIDYYRPILENMEITLPEEMFDHVKADQKNNIGNRVVMYNDKGIEKVLSEE